MKYRDYVRHFIDRFDNKEIWYGDKQIHIACSPGGHVFVTGDPAACISVTLKHDSTDREVWESMLDLWRRLINWPTHGHDWKRNDEVVWTTCVATDVLCRLEYPPRQQVKVYHLHLYETDSSMQFDCVDHINYPNSLKV